MNQTGLSKNTSAALSYVLGPITGIVFLIIEKDPFVRFHAMQSIVVFGFLFVVSLFLVFTIIFIPLIFLVKLLSFALWLILIYEAFSGKEFGLPIAGDISRRLLKKI